MAREPEKTGRESGRAKTDGSTQGRAATGTGRTAASAAENNSDENKSDESNSGESKSGGTGGGKAGIKEYQSERHNELQQTLAKRSKDGANVPAIIKEFAALWLPHHMVEVELLVPALEDADVDEDKRVSVAIRKDMLNILLADLIESGAAQGTNAKLEALSDALDAVIAASQQEAEAITEASDESTLNKLGQEMQDRYERLKNRFADFDSSIGDAIRLLAPRSISVFSAHQRSRRESEMPRYSGGQDRDGHGRFVSEEKRRYSRSGRGYRSGERDEGDRYEGRRYRSREDEDEGRYAETGRRSMSRSRDEDEEEGRYGGSGRRSLGRERDEDEGGYSGESRMRGQGGWFGESEGHSEAARRGWERSGHDESGWYGDRVGHSQASRRGWEQGHRSQRRDEDDDRDGRRGEDRYGSGYDDEDRRGGYGDRYEGRRGGGRDEDERYVRSGRSRGGHGGWSGDPEGLSEAARRGREHRR